MNRPEAMTSASAAWSSRSIACTFRERSRNSTSRIGRPIPGAVGPVIHEGPRETLGQGDLGLPPERLADLRVIGIVAADVNRLLSRRKRDAHPAPTPMEADEELRQLPQAHRRIAADIVHLAVGDLARGGQEHGLDDVVDIAEVALLGAVPIDRERLAVKQPSDPPSEERLTGVLDPHARPIDVRQPEDARPDPRYARRRDGSARRPVYW